jgi:hypothetical protein
MAKQNVIVRFTPAMIEELRKESEERGISVSEIVRERVDYAIRFPEPLEKFLDDFAEKLNFSRSQVLAAIMVDYVARHTAYKDVWQSDKRVLWEFARTEDGPLGTRKLYTNLYQNYKRDYDEEKKKLFYDELTRAQKHGFGEKRIRKLYHRFGYKYPEKQGNEDVSEDMSTEGDPSDADWTPEV